MSTERNQLLLNLRILIDTYKQSDDRELKSAAAVLASLSGALYAGSAEQLMRIATEFSDREIKRLSASRN
jgi:hypothetical protein